MKIWIYWIYFYIVLNKKLTNLLVWTEFYWSWFGGLVLIVRIYIPWILCFWLQLSKSTAVADEAIGNVRTVRAFAMEPKENEFVHIVIDNLKIHK
jgi:hypothetical protein